METLKSERQKREGWEIFWVKVSEPLNLTHFSFTFFLFNVFENFGFSFSFFSFFNYFLCQRFRAVYITRNRNDGGDGSSLFADAEKKRINAQNFFFFNLSWYFFLIKIWVCMPRQTFFKLKINRYIFHPTLNDNDHFDIKLKDWGLIWHSWKVRNWSNTKAKG